ncbi:primosome assembly protein PriA [Aeromicrobium sp. Leaf350]|uniref:primosomal protein N' family DNA-binding protein n=1 Tax=Aeromicrobium sp. Leaf350 TaxID=2876565 RepID=UPI001E327C67|nr:primosome assembly protein PriA [Aeromicrobium sp. Leaf350]
MTDDGQLDLGVLPDSVAAPAPKPVADARKAPPEPAPELSVARVQVDTGLAHLDRPFDYLVPATLHETAVPGCRVKVRFAGRQTDGYLLERVAASDHEGVLAPLAKVLSSEPVLAPEVLGLARSVVDRWAGTVGDVLRLAIPPRHARAEAASRPVPPTDDLPQVDAGRWAVVPGAASYLGALRDGRPARAVRSVLPTEDPAHVVAQAVLATLHAGRGSIVCVPDAADLARWDATFTEVLGPGRHVVLAAGQGPSPRYRAFLGARRGDVQVVLGTRAAAWAPVHHLGLVATWDDGDDLFAEPRAPYAHTREVLLTRAHEQDAGVLLAAHARSAEAQALVDSGWCVELEIDDAVRRSAWTRPVVTDGSTHGSAPARLPSEVFGAIREAEGPVLVQVPRRGYRASLSCQGCREPARCSACAGPLAQLASKAQLVCRWCATPAPDWSCPHCGSRRLRAPVVGQLRTAEEYTRAFPDHEVVTSGGETVLADVEPGRRIVLATPGAEPHVAGGYDVVVLMDTWLALGRDDVRVVEEAHRRWFNALALAAPGGRAIAVGDPGALQALVRADPVGLARRELEQRRETHLPPFGRLATLEASPDVLGPLADRTWTPHTEVLGPVPADPRDPSVVRLVLRAPRSEGPALSDALRQVSAERSAAKATPVRVQVDPLAF